MSSEHTSRYLADAVGVIFNLGKEAAEKDAIIKGLGVAIENAEAWKADAMRRFDTYERNAEMQRVVIVNLREDKKAIQDAHDELDAMTESQRDVIASREAMIQTLGDSVGEAKKRADIFEEENLALRKALGESVALSKSRKETIRSQAETLAAVQDQLKAEIDGRGAFVNESLRQLEEKLKRTEIESEKRLGDIRTMRALLKQRDEELAEARKYIRQLEEDANNEA